MVKNSWFGGRVKEKIADRREKIADGGSGEGEGSPSVAILANDARVTSMDIVDDETGPLPTASDRHLQSAIRPNVQREVLKELQEGDARLDSSMRATVNARAKLSHKAIQRLWPCEPSDCPELWAPNLGDESAVSRLAEGIGAEALLERDQKNKWSLLWRNSHRAGRHFACDFGVSKRRSLQA